jgi:MFS superfamily sulfate permease-like transporter
MTRRLHFTSLSRTCSKFCYCKAEKAALALAFFPKPVHFPFPPMSIPQSNVPGSGSGGMRIRWRADGLAGFLVFLLALPLCLVIAGASWFAPLAGILIAIVGGVLGLAAGRFGLSIKWSIAGLFIVAVGAVEELSQGDAGRGHHLALATTVVASIAAGVLANFTFQLYRGVSLRSLFSVSTGDDSNADGSHLRIIIHKPLVTSNYLILKNYLETLPIGQHIVIDLSQARLVDHTVLENLRQFQHAYFDSGGRVELLGLQAAPRPAPAPNG